MCSSDHLAPTTAYGDDASLESWPEAGSAFNIGIMVFRKNGLRFVEECVDAIEKDLSVWDQNAFNDLARRGGKDGGKDGGSGGGRPRPLGEIGDDPALDLPASAAESVAAAGAALALDAREHPAPGVPKNVSAAVAKHV